MSVDIEKICRTCLGLSGPLLSIYDSSSQSSGAGCLADMISDFTKFKPKRSDKLPEKVCLNCISEINHCYSFKLKCENSNRTLRQLLPDAAPEEVAVEQIVKPAQEHKEVQTMSPIKQKSTVVHQQIQTDEEVAKIIAPLVVSDIAQKRKKLPEKTKELADGNLVEKKMIERRRTEDSQGEEEFILELIDEGVATEKKNFKHLSKAPSAREEHTTYYELSNSKVNYNQGEERLVIQSVESLKYEKQETLEMEKEPEREEYVQDDEEQYEEVIYTATTEGDEKEPDYSFTLYDGINGETHIMPKYASTAGKKADEHCPDCEKSFISKKTLRRHMIKKHNYDAEEIETMQEVQELQRPETPQRILRSQTTREHKKFKCSSLNEEEEAEDTDEFDEEEESMLVVDVHDNTPSTKYNEDLYSTQEQVSGDEENSKAASNSGQTDFQSDLDGVNFAYHCERCNAGFALLRSLHYHQRRNACFTLSFKCDSCDRVFISRRKLQEHKEIHAYSHTCNECNSAFATVEELTQHMVNAHKRNVRNQCHICQKVFTMISTLRDHMRTHNGEKPFKCNICDRGFSQKANLKQHMQRHNNDKQFKCDECPSSFVTKAELYSHQRRHSGATPYKCEYCDSAFTTSSSLLKHRRKHTGERPYACDICPMRFSSLNVLKNHRRTHTGEKPYKCNYCDKAFTQKGDCLIHQRTHSNNSPLSCYHCGRYFTAVNLLRNHMKTHDKGSAALRRKRPASDDEPGKDEDLHITIVEDDISEQQHSSVSSEQVTQASNCDDELIQMNIEMC